MDTRPVGGCQAYEGRAIDESGRPVAGLHVLQRSRGELSPDVVVDTTTADGRFTTRAGGEVAIVTTTSKVLPLVPQTAGTPNLQPHRLGSITLGSRLCATLDAAGHAEVVDVLMQRGAILTGRFDIPPGVSADQVQWTAGVTETGATPEPYLIPVNAWIHDGTYRIVGLPTLPDGGLGYACTLKADPGKGTAFIGGQRVSTTVGRTTTHDITATCDFTPAR